MKKLLLLLTICLGFGLTGWAQATGITYSQDTVGCAPLTTGFSVSFTGTATAYTWSFGDGNFSTAASPTHTYTQDGAYFPFVDVTIMGMGTQRFFPSGPVLVGAPDVFFIQPTQALCERGQYQFQGFIDSTYNFNNQVTFDWTVTRPDGSVLTSLQEFPIFDFNQGGTYTVQLNAYTDPACQDSLISTFVLDTVAFNPSITDASCGNNDGSISINPSVGGPFFNGFILWSTGDSSTVINNLAAGSYTAQLTYGQNFQCTATDTFEVGETGLLDYTISSVNVACLQDSTGSIDITINASDGPVTFSWSNGATTEDLNNIPGGIYTVTIADNTCSFVETIDIDSDSLFVDLVSTDATCAGTAGSIEAVVSGGQTPYSYSWSNGVTTSINPNVAVGGYSVIVTDATGCADQEVGFVEAADSCFYELSGRVYFDQNGNCVFDGTDFYISGGWMRLAGTNQYTFIDSLGNYSFSVPSGTYTIEPNPSSFPYFSPVCPGTGNYNPTVTFQDINGLDFAMQADTNLIDLAVFVSNGVIRPGFTHTYYIRAWNFGSTPMSGLVSFTHDPLVTYLNSTPTAVNYDLPSRTAIWSFSNLLPGRWVTYEVQGSIASTVPLGTSINLLADVGPITGDVDPNNNVAQRVSTVRGSFDPNDKLVLPVGEGPEGFIEPTENQMEYTIRFQNTGTFPAEFVILRDTIDANLRVSSIKPTGASHAYQMTLDGNALEVRFDNINLPDSASDPAGSQGYFSFLVGHEGVLPPLTEIKNTAAIYFDFNAPIITNTVMNTIAEPSSVFDPQKEGVSLYPNPSEGNFQVNSLNRSIEDIKVYDMTGRLVLHSDKQHIDLGQERPGIYIVRIQTDKGMVTKRLSLRK